MKIKKENLAFTILNLTEVIYNNGYSANHILQYINSNIEDDINKLKFCIFYEKHKIEIKNEKILIFINLAFLFIRFNVDLEKYSFNLKSIMDDYNIASLTESKNEWAARLNNILTPCIIQGIKSIFDESYKLCIDNDEETKYLMTFQNLLNNVPKWSNEIVNTEKERILTSKWL